MSFANERRVAAVRKARRCEGCCSMVEIGQPAIRWAGVTDGDFYSAVYHSECREAEIALNDFHGTYAEEWIGLASGREHEDNDWLREHRPIVAARLGIIPVPLSSRAEGNAKPQKQSKERSDGSL